MDEMKNIEVKKAFDEAKESKENKETVQAEQTELPQEPKETADLAGSGSAYDEMQRAVGNDVLETPESVTARDAWHAKMQGMTQGTKGPQGGAAAQGTFSQGTSGYAGAARTSGRTAVYGPVPKKGKKKPMLIFCGIVAAMVLLGVLMGMLDIGDDSDVLSDASNVDEKHIGVLYIEGSIMDGDSTYDHDYVLDAIEGMLNNDKNKGLMLYVNSPGGGVYESDEVYLKIREYQHVTGRPVYAYFGSQATSGGYYVAASADKIVANRNCWTGSIGVIIGTLYDISGLLEQYDIKAENIVSGDNKAMGGMAEPLTDEQRKIMQSLVDEAYDQFVSIIAEGRNLSEAYVRSISDGRIYSARQAMEIGLVDGVVNTYEGALDDMKQEFGLHGCKVYDFRHEADRGLWESFVHSIDRLADASSESSDIGALTRLMEGQQEFSLQYMCEVTK